MPKNLSLASVIQKNQIAQPEAWLIALKIHVRNHVTGGVVDVIRVVNNTEITTIDDEEYEPFAFDIDLKESSSGLPTLSVTIQDQTQIVQSFMQRYGGAVNSDVELMIVRASDATTTYLEPELVEYFLVIKSSVDDYVVKWELGAENPLRRQCPLRKQEPDQCSYRYKDPNTCAYSGSLTSCDLTLNGANGCRAHGNASNYGGFPGIVIRS